MTLAVTTIMPDGTGETTIPADAWLSVSAGRRLGGIGTAMLTIRKEDIPTGAFAAGRIVRVYDDATLLAAFLPLRPGSQLTEADKETGNRIVTYPGVDVMQLLDHGAVWWPDGLDDVREILYGWAHPEFDATGYTNPVAWGTVGNPGLLPSSRPEGFPDQNAQLITAVAAFGEGERTDYFFADFTLTAETRMWIGFGGDDEYDVYLQGALIASKKGPNPGKQASPPVIYTLPAGTYRVAVRLHNLDRGNNDLNASWIAGSGIEVDGNDEPTGTVIFRTSTSWVHLPDPATEPGFNAGELARVLLEGPQGRGVTVLDHVTRDFTDSVDPDGNPWTAVYNLRLPVMADLAEVFTSDFRDVGIETVMTPDLQLQVWETDGAGDDLTATIDLGADNLLLPGSTWDGAREVASVFGRLDRDGRWVEHEDAALVAAHGRVEREWEYAAPSPDFTVAAAFDDFAGDREHGTFLVRRSDLPADVGPGAWLSGELLEGGAGTWRVEHVDVTSDLIGEAMLTLTAVLQ